MIKALHKAPFLFLYFENVVIPPEDSRLALLECQLLLEAK